MNPGRVYAIVLRYLYGIPHGLPRLFDIFFWPLVAVLVWGIIFWPLLDRASQDVAVQLLEDIWARNFLNLFASPLRLSEFIAALLIVTLLKVLVTFAIIAAIAYGAYAFD